MRDTRCEMCVNDMCDSSVTCVLMTCVTVGVTCVLLTCVTVVRHVC